MQGSKSAKNVMTSCSLGPKSELRQPDQVIADRTVKILIHDTDVRKKESEQMRERYLNMQERQQATD